MKQFILISLTLCAIVAGVLTSPSTALAGPIIHLCDYYSGPGEMTYCDEWESGDPIPPALDPEEVCIRTWGSELVISMGTASYCIRGYNESWCDYGEVDATGAIACVDYPG